MSEIQSTKRTDLMKVDLANIEIEEGFNVRKEMGNIEELAKSIASLGQIEPAKGYKKPGEDKYVLTDGHRRFAAAKLANELGLDGAPNILTLVPSSKNMVNRLYEMAVTGVEKKPLEPIEEANVYLKLVEAGEKVDDIALKMGKSRPHVYTRLNLLDLNEEIQEMVKQGKLSATTAVNESRKIKKGEKTEEEVLETLKDAVESKKDGKKATAKNVNGSTDKTPLNKLEEAIRILDERKLDSDEVNVLKAVVEKLKKKKSTAEDIANLFN